METGYKPLVETPDRGLISLWAGGGAAGTVLEYKEGEITYTPKGSAGIWVSKTLEQAKDSGFGNKNKVGVLIVYEVTPLGERMGEGEGFSTPSSFARDIRYPAILLGKEVWREEEPRPEPKFKVGDRVVLKDAKGEYCGVQIGMVGVVVTPSISSTVIRMPVHNHYYVQEKYLELAPVEEWVDVTGECTLRMSCMEGRVSVCHNGAERLLLGSKGAYLWRCQNGRHPEDNYKVELTDGNYSCGTFTVFKKK